VETGVGEKTALQTVPAEPAAPSTGERRRRLPGVLLWVVLVAAIAASGWGLIESNRLAAEAREQLDQLDHHSRQITAMEQLIESNRAALANGIERLERQQQELQAGLYQLRSSTPAGEIVPLREAIHLSRMGAETLRIRLDPALATALFEGAYQRLRWSSDPRIESPRSQLSVLIDQLKRLPPPGRQRVADEISTLRSLLPRLPLRKPEPAINSDQPLPTAPQEPFNWPEWQEAFSDWLLATVRIERDGQPPVGLIEPAHRQLLMLSMQAQADGARIALYADDQEGVREALAALRESLVKQFDSNNDRVKEAISLVAGLLGRPTTPPLPDPMPLIHELERIAATTPSGDPA
jgi:uncharacterized protein HemX